MLVCRREGSPRREAKCSRVQGGGGAGKGAVPAVVLKPLWGSLQAIGVVGGATGVQSKW